MKQQIETILNAVYQRVALRERWALATVEVTLENPPSLGQGDFACALPLKLASTLKRAPLEIASRLLSEAQQDQALLKVAEPSMAAPGFLNFSLRDDVLKSSAHQTAKNRARRQTVIVEYSSPNVAKPMGVGHLRSTIIGDSVKRILQFLGYRVVAINHLGDWGTQMGKLLVAWKRQRADRGRKKSGVRTIDIAHLLKLYVQFHADAEKDKTLDEQARIETKKLQDGDKENLGLWRQFVAASAKEFTAIYKLLGVRFDSTRGESAYQSKLRALVAGAFEHGIARQSEGAVIIPFADGLSPMLIEKSDGAYLYGTTDLAAVQYRMAHYRPVRIIYVVGNEQSLHFEQLKRAAQALGIASSDMIVHVKFGLMTIEGKKFSTRKGRTVDLARLLAEAVARAEKLLNNRDITVREKKEVARIIGIGAVKYHDLSQHRNHDIAFDWDRMLSLTGNSAPYLQYVVVRIKSIMRKAKIPNPKSQIHNPSSKGGSSSGGQSTIHQWRLLPAEREILRRMLRFQEIVEQAAASYEPHRIAEYIYTLAGSFNRFYETIPVLDSPEPERSARLLLIRRVADTIETGLGLLGIEVPKRM